MISVLEKKVSWSNGPTNEKLIRTELLHNLFEESSDRYPTNIAIEFENKRLTYSEVETKANKLAHYLRSNGVKRGDKVAILLQRSVEQYISILAIMKAGAAYVPLDPGYPQDRIAYILGDCDVHTLITTSDIEKHQDLGVNTVLLDSDSNSIEQQSSERLSELETELTPADLAYIIYTSGTTGQPKGVQIEHRSICHLVRAQQIIYQIEPTDRVYQGFTIAFDASVEEVWMALANGATLVSSSLQTVRAGSELANILTELRITVLSCVPTLLSMMQEDIPTLKLLIVGGEECPQYLVDRWALPSRRMLNTYGPTEATVIATYSECRPGKPVTIGNPLPNYSICILDESLELVPSGELGELCIGGIGLARGYVNRDELTKQKFITKKLEGQSEPIRLYRTGDLVRFNEEGEIEFHGRIDTQVKIRGFRIELSEIESVLSTVPGVKMAVASVYEEAPGVQNLVAYLVKEADADVDLPSAYEKLKDKLPAYMLPSYFEFVDDIPTLPSGKVDRKNLPKPNNRYIHNRKVDKVPRSELEQKIAEAWCHVFKIDQISITDNFFDDLGGHSLFATMVVSKLREDARMRNLSVPDLYANPTIETLALLIESRLKQNRLVQESHQEVEKDEQQLLPKSNAWYKICGSIQAIGIYFKYALMALPLIIFYDWLGPNDLYTTPIYKMIGMALVLGTAYFPFMLLVSILAKWVLIGRFKEGSYPLWGWYYIRWWFVNKLQALVPTPFMIGTPLMPLYLRLMGAKVGSNCYIATEHIGIYDLLTIGDNCSIGFDAQLLGYTIEDGMLKIGRIDIGHNCYVGTNAILCPSSTMESGAKLGEQSLLLTGHRIPKGEMWVGSPGVRTNHVDPDLVQMEKDGAIPRKIDRILFGLAHGVSSVILAYVPMIALLPGALLMLWLSEAYGYWYLLASPLLALTFIICLSIQVIGLKWIVLRKENPGQYSLYSFYYLRKWFIDRLINMGLTLMNPIYATIYTPPFLKLLGAKIGNRTEVSTATHITPDLLDIEAESFIADSVCIGAPKVHRGLLMVNRTKIGRKTFIGNSALIPSGNEIGNECLIGVLTVPPQKEVTDSGTSWLGSPAMFLPKRDVNKSFSEKETYNPPRGLYIARAIIEYFRITLPITINILSFGLLIYFVDVLSNYFDDIQISFLIPIGLFIADFAGTLAVVLLKKVLIGTYKPGVKPLWSTYVWRNELITALYENVTVPVLFSTLTGTPFVNGILRLYGMKIGKRVFLETPFITEFDLITIGDDAAINTNVTLQPHLFEDRIFKMSYINIGEGCSIGAGSVILYDSKMLPKSSLGSLSLVMKGESLPARTKWIGSPAKCY